MRCPLEQDLVAAKSPDRAPAIAGHRANEDAQAPMEWSSRHGDESERGDERLRALLSEAATVILTRVRSASALRSFALALKKRLGFTRAAVSYARKLAVVLHVMWKTGKNFEPNDRLAAA